MWSSSGGIFDYDAKALKLNEVDAALEDPAVWNNPQLAGADSWVGLHKRENIKRHVYVRAPCCAVHRQRLGTGTKQDP